MTTNFVICAGGSNNTGQNSCEYTPGIIGGHILIPKGKTFSASDQIAMETVLPALLANANKAQRAYPIIGFENADDKSIDSVTASYGYGKEVEVRDGKIGAEYKLLGGLCTWSNLRTFNKCQDKYDVILIDTTNNCLLGTAKANGAMGGFALSKYTVQKPNLNNGANPFEIMVGCLFANLNEWERFSIVQYPNEIDVMSTCIGLLTASIKVTVPMSGGGVIKCKVLTSCGNVSLGPTFGTQLADPLAWTAYVIKVGVSLNVPVATVAYNDILDEFTVTLTLPSGGGALAVGTIINLNLGVIGQLVALNVVGYEGTPTTVVVP
jgi:hypothetical protein